MNQSRQGWLNYMKIENLLLKFNYDGFPDTLAKPSFNLGKSKTHCKK